MNKGGFAILRSLKLARLVVQVGLQGERCKKVYDERDQAFFLRLRAFHRLNLTKWANDGDRTRDHGVTIHCLYHLTTSAIRLYSQLL